MALCKRKDKGDTEYQKFKSWFASKRLEESENDLVLNFVGLVKTNTKKIM